VVAVGLTDAVPPPGGTVGLLPSEPEITTLVAFVAATLSVLEPPAEIGFGLAVMVTVGTGGGGAGTTVTVAVAVTVNAPLDAVAV
jgi:hypothetical protein